MNELSELRLIFDRILHIDSSSSSWNISLQSLDLSENLLCYLNKSAFIGLDSLKILDLSYNRFLRSISLGFINLEYLNVSGTSLINADELFLPNLIFLSFSMRLVEPYSAGKFFRILKHFVGQSSLQAIDLAKSQIQLNDLWDPDKNSSLFHNFRNLIVLSLQMNKLRTLPRGIFSRLSSLQELILTHCDLLYIHPNVFDGLYSLTSLCLANNHLVYLPATLFLTTTSLMALYIRNNILTYLDDNLFMNTRNLSILTIDRNEFTTFNVSTFRPIISSLKMIDVSENPFECECDFRWMVDWFRNSSDLEQLNEGTCSPGSVSKANIAGKSLTRIVPGELCHTHLELYWLIPFTVIALCIICVIAIHSRWILRYKLFLLKLAVLGFREIQDARDHSDFQYDLNIVFTGNDEAWAAEYLRRSVKEHLPDFKTIAFGDDALPFGMYYLDAIQYVIENSFKTILVVSRASIRDHDFMMKMRIALNNTIDTNMQSTILVFLDNIPEDGMPYLIKLYLSEQMEYINWKIVQRVEGYFGNRW